MNMKRFVAVLLVLLFVSGFLWANGDAEKAPDPNKTYAIKLTSADSINTIWMTRMKKACTNIFLATKGKVDIQMYPSGEMLVYDEGIEAVMSNTAVIYFTDPSMFADYVPAYNAICAPYNYSTYETVEKLMASDTMKAMNADAAKAGLHAVTTSFVVGCRNVLANIPIRKVEDMKGLKIRVPSISIYTDTFGALGTNFSPMPFSEVYGAMQTGVINAVEVTPGNAYNYKIYEALGKGKAYYSMTKHMLNVVGLFTGEGFWQSLPKQYSDIIAKEMQAAAYDSNREVAKSDDALIQKMVADGVTLITIDDLSGFKAKVEPVCKKFVGYDKVIAQISTLR
jgi:TRAP-type transport system periplasmic protein